MGKNVILNSHQLSHTIFGVRAFEVLHLETYSESVKTIRSLYFIRKKFLPLKFVRLVLEATLAKM